VSDQKLEEIVRATLAQIAPEADMGNLAGDEAFNEQLDIDSMDFLNFVIALDEATGVEIPERDYAQLATLDGCVRYLEAHANTDAR
jgi:acyl carrier protein